MSIPRPSEILVRAGGRTLQRFGVLAIGGGSRRTLEEITEVFARADATKCATYLDRDGTMRMASANVPRIHYTGLLNAQGEPICGPLVENLSQNLIENGNFEADAVGTSAFGGAAIARDLTQARLGVASLKVTTAAGVNTGYYIRNRAGTRMAVAASTTYTATCWVFATGGAIGKQPCLGIEWWNGTPAVSRTDFGPTPALVAGWNLMTATFQSPADAVTAQCFFENVTNQGVVDYWVDLHQFELGFFSTSSIPTGTGALTRQEDDLRLPLPFGARNLTVLARIGRPNWADLAGNIGFAPGLFTIGVNLPVVMAFADANARQFGTQIRDGTTIQGPALANIPAGNELTPCFQFRNLTTGGLAKQDVGDGSGYGADSAAALPFATFGDAAVHVIRLGFRTGAAGTSLGSVISDFIVANGLFTRAEMLAIP